MDSLELGLPSLHPIHLDPERKRRVVIPLLDAPLVKHLTGDPFRRTEDLNHLRRRQSGAQSGQVHRRLAWLAAQRGGEQQ